MHFAFSEDQLMLRDTVRDVLSKECAPEVVRKAWESPEAGADAVWSTLAENGFVAMCASEDAGGMGMNEVDLALVLEETGYAALPEPFLECVTLAVPLLERFGTDAQKAEWLERATTGDARLLVVFADQTVAPHSPRADALLIARGEGLYLVPREAASLSEQVAVDRATRIATVAYAPDDAHLMAAGDDVVAALAVAKDRATVGLAAQLCGLARRMLDLAVDYAKDREQFGKPIGAQQAVQHHLANVAMKLAFAQPVTYRAAWALANRDADGGSDGEDAAREAELAVSMAKIYAEDAARTAAKTALQVHGAIGYTIECDLHFFMKRVWTYAPLYGTAAEHRERIGAHIL